MKQTVIVKRMILALSFCVTAMLVHAQVDPGGDPGGAIGAVPVDGGLAFLLAAGVGYGAKKAYDYRNRNQVNEEEKN
jgi:hypothetical protein